MHAPPSAPRRRVLPCRPARRGAPPRGGVITNCHSPPISCRPPQAKCKPCGGSAICEHGREQHQCRKCGGASICEHKRQKSVCKRCKALKPCEHGESQRAIETARCRRARPRTHTRARTCIRTPPTRTHHVTHALHFAYSVYSVPQARRPSIARSAPARTRSAPMARSGKSARA